MMTEEEYQNAIFAIMKSGYGYKAIIDITGHLNNMHENAVICMKEMLAERKAVKKICEGKSSNKNKIDTVLSMYAEKGEELK